jgi:hypothetical protein
MTMTREAKIERQRREVVCMWQVDERTRKTQLREVSMQRQTLDAAKGIGQVRWRCADGARHVDKAYAVR